MLVSMNGRGSTGEHLEREIESLRDRETDRDTERQRDREREKYLSVCVCLYWSVQSVWYLGIGLVPWSGGGSAGQGDSPFSMAPQLTFLSFLSVLLPSSKCLLKNQYGETSQGSSWQWRWDSLQKQIRPKTKNYSRCETTFSSFPPPFLPPILLSLSSPVLPPPSPTSFMLRQTCQP